MWKRRDDQSRPDSGKVSNVITFPPDPHPSAAVPPDIPAALTPRHVAIIMDGNGRWAARRGLPRLAGHQAAIPAMLDVIDGALQTGIEYLSLFTFSTENWKRSPDEVGGIFNIMSKFLSDNTPALAGMGVRICRNGRQGRLPSSLADTLMASERATMANTRMTLTFCIDYGSRDEISHAARVIAEDTSAGRLSPADIDEATLPRYFFQPGQPDVDLLIRTSGEYRISNFLLWQIAYAELVFTDVLWPDFDRLALWAAIEEYAGHGRRSGGAGAAS